MQNATAVANPTRTEPTALIGRWIAGVRPDHLPQEVVKAARLAMLDTLAVGLSGFDQPWTGIVRQWIDQGGRTVDGTATVWGEAHPWLKPSDAALVNGSAAHAFDYDDYVAKLHPGAVVVPAVLALAERLDSPAERIALAIAVGYEIDIRTSLALDPNAARVRGWHLTGVCGPLAAAAGCAILLGLDEMRTRHALGLAGTQGSGLFSFNAEGAMNKRLHAGIAARAGLMAAELAALGFTGPSRIYEEEDGGFLRTFSDASDPAPLTDGLGERWVFLGNRFKPYPACGSAHAYIDAALEIRRRLGRAPKPDDEIRAGIARVVDLQCGFPYRPGSALTAQMSVRYCLAVALREGAVLPPQFADEFRSDPEIVALAERLDLVPDAGLDASYPARYGAWVEVRSAEGKTERVEVEDASGSPSNPHREDVLREKIRSLFATYLRDDAVRRLDAIADGNESARARELMQLLAART